MNFLDKAIAFVAPQKALAREKARHQIRIYEGATWGRRGSSFRALSTGVNSEMQLAIRPLRDRCRDLARNSPHIPRALDVLTAHIVGNGILPVPRTGSDKLDRQVQNLWENWNESADVTGELSFYAMQALAVRSMIESGEVVGRFIDRPLDKKLCVPVQMQLLEADYIDQYRDGIYGDPYEKRTDLVKSRLGVGLGEFDKRIGLWLWSHHPGEVMTINIKPLISEFCDGADLIHMFRPLRPGQVRGVPWLAPALMTARDLADFIDAVNVKARVEACFSGFITNDDSTMPLLSGDNDPWTHLYDPSNSGAQTATLEPGMMKELRSGQDIKFAQPTSTTQIQPILEYNLRAIGAALGLPYHMISGDLSQTNYSSMRAGNIDFFKLVSQLQKHVITPQFCTPVWNRFISRAILSGALKGRPERYCVDWIVPSKEAVDPSKDLQADVDEVRAGRMTPQSFIASRGGNWRRNLQAFADFNNLAEELGLTFTTNAGKVDDHGRALTAPLQNDPDNDPDSQIAPADPEDGDDSE